MAKVSQKYSALVWSQFKKNKMALFGLIVVLTLFSVAIFAPLIANDKPYICKIDSKIYFPIIKYYPELQGKDFKRISREPGDVWMFMPPVPYSANEYNLDLVLEGPSLGHLLGTDEQGRDILTRLIYGSRISLSVGFVAVGIYVLIGIVLGALAGYYGGWIDMIISRFIEIMICFPTFFLILTILAFVGPNIYNIMIVIGVTGWTGIARIIRGEFLRLREQDYVRASQISGAKNRRIIFRHILPNAIAPVLVSATFGIASAILVESSLSFLGFGVPPHVPSWGYVLSQSREFMDVAWWLTIFPGFAIFITITAYNLVGEGLRDAIDPRLRT
ncbi:ABC transporter permease [bacterium]|nr:ABC transporter permease [bacterium]